MLPKPQERHQKYYFGIETDNPHSQQASDLGKHPSSGVEVTGFEPVAPSLRTKCSAWLSYTPAAEKHCTSPPLSHEEGFSRLRPV